MSFFLPLFGDSKVKVINNDENNLGRQILAKNVPALNLRAP